MRSYGAEGQEVPAAWARLEGDDQVEPALPPGAAGIGHVVEFTIPAATKSGNETKRMHFRVFAQYQRALRYEVLCAAGKHRLKEPFPWARLTIWRYSSGVLDRDNLFGGCKALIDCLTTPFEKTVRSGPLKGTKTLGNALGLGFIVDDNPKVCDLHAFSMRSTRRNEKTVVRIEELLRAGVEAAP
jgi:hypothetical protein